MSYGPDIAEMSRRSAPYIDKVLTGMKPAELPIEQPTKFDLVINLKIAKALGLTVPATVLARASQVIEPENSVYALYCRCSQPVLHSFSEAATQAKVVR